MSCDSGSIDNLKFYNKRKVWMRGDVLPFIPTYAVLLFKIFTADETESFIPGVSRYNLSLFFFFVVLVANIFTYLSTFWTVGAECWLTCSSASDPKRATWVRVTPIAHKGKAKLVPLLFKDVESPDSNQTLKEISFEFQRRTFRYDSNDGIFHKPKYPLNEPLNEYLSTEGIVTEPDYKQRMSRWSYNHCDIPLPSFIDLYIEQATAPFFVFQVFAVSLWMLDEYWLYSLFTLFMLLVFEATVVKSRQRNLLTLRAMANRPPRVVFVYRGRQWQRISAVGLVPGDIVSVARDVKPTNEQIAAAKQAGQIIPPLDDSVPCDCVLIRGSCVVNEAMLTGESTPKLKESLEELTNTGQIDAKQIKLDVVKHRRSVLFAGTSLLQTTTGSGKMQAPDGGAVAYVIRTGFETSQGKLLRTILFGTERMTANSKEAMMFIMVLLVFALIAGAYVLSVGLQDDSRDRWKLFLNCTMIITSVVPPELPMELSLAVNTSLMNLVKDGIFCTEPFRIPLAGKVVTCCFDKTGTLTRSNLRLLGIAGRADVALSSPDDDATNDDDDDDNDTDAAPQAESDLVAPVDIAPDSFASIVVSGCHALAKVGEDLIGDPLEASALAACGWSITGYSPTVATHAESGRTTKVVARHHFSSALKRMSTICEIVDPTNDSNNKKKSNTKAFVALVKGAPETIGERLTNKPDNYDEVHRRHALRGRRVLALAYNVLDTTNNSKVRGMARAVVESNLTFAGFLVFSCPAKKDAKQTMETLRAASHSLVMITGDATLTAAAVASDVALVEKPVAVLRDTVWENVDGTFIAKSDEFASVCEKYALCLSDTTLDVLFTDESRATALFGDNAALRLLPLVSVFARASPVHKERILATLKHAGKTTLMCGDGTNDVGALKQAHVGIAVLNRGNPPKKRRVKIGDLKGAAKKAAEEKVRKRRAEKRARGEAFETPRQRRLRELHERLEANEPPPPALGDASIASAFTSKWSNVMPIANVIRQGRCTLVTTLQVYKILALNCLVQAYNLSVLYLMGVRLADTQMTMTGLLIAFCFLFVSRSKPVDELAPQRPQPNLFSPYAIVSTVGQLAIHLYVLSIGSKIANEAMLKHLYPTPNGLPLAITDDDVFVPTLLNSVMFLFVTIISVSNFLANYRGHPFMQSLTDNKPLLYALMAVAFVVFFCASESSRDFNELLELVPFPSIKFRKTVALTMIGDLVGAFLVEHIARRLFQS